jgi:hypothetical protein
MTHDNQIISQQKLKTKIYNQDFVKALKNFLINKADKNITVTKPIQTSQKQVNKVLIKEIIKTKNETIK